MLNPEIPMTESEEFGKRLKEQLGEVKNKKDEFVEYLANVEFWKGDESREIAMDYMYYTLKKKKT